MTKEKAELLALAIKGMIDARLMQPHLDDKFDIETYLMIKKSKQSQAFNEVVKVLTNEI